MERDRWKIISPLLDQALEMNAGERATWLASLRAQDPALAVEVETYPEHLEAMLAGTHEDIRIARQLASG